MRNKDKKKVSKTGWMPFWWGNKFNKRLSSKRVRRKEREHTEALIAMITRDLNRRGMQDD